MAGSSIRTVGKLGRRVGDEAVEFAGKRADTAVRTFVPDPNQAVSDTTSAAATAAKSAGAVGVTGVAGVASVKGLQDYTDNKDVQAVRNDRKQQQQLAEEILSDDDLDSQAKEALLRQAAEQGLFSKFNPREATSGEDPAVYEKTWVQVAAIIAIALYLRGRN